MQKPLHWIRNMALWSASRETLLWLGIFLFLWGIGKGLDGVVFDWIEPWRSSMLDDVAVGLTEFGIYVVVVLLVLLAAYRVCRHPQHTSKLVPAVFSIFLASVLSSVFKSLFRIVRPSWELGLEPLVAAGSFSFPSGHTATMFAVLIPMWRISRGLGFLWGAFGLLVGIARIYEKVHYPSDIAAGIFLGGVIGAFFSNPDIQAFLHQKWKSREFRRQTFHLITGFLCVFLHWVGVLRLRELGIFLVIGLFLSLASQYRKIPGLSYLLERFDRPRDRSFPGRGAFYFLLGVFLCFLLFNRSDIPIAYASILILSVGDSFNHYIAPYLGDDPLPWNTQKRWAGLFLGIFMGTLAAQFFVPWYDALLASTVALLLETYVIKIGPYYIDDNLIVPLVSGGVLWGLG